MQKRKKMNKVYVLVVFSLVSFSLVGQSNDWKDQYDFVGRYFGQLAQVKVGEKYGWVDREGNEIAAPKYDHVYLFKGGYGTVYLNGKWGMINEKGELVIPLKYERLKDFSDGLALAMLGGKIGYIDETNQVVIPFHLLESESFKNGYAVGRTDTGKGVIDIEGKTVIPFEFDFVERYRKKSNYSNSIMINSEPEDPDRNKKMIFHAKKHLSVTYFNEKGEQLNYHKYVGTYDSGIAYYRDSTPKFGFVNGKGEILIPLTYDNTKGYRYGLLAVQKAEKWGYINLANETVIPFEFDDARSFNSSKEAKVKIGDGPFFKIDREGNRVEE